jgi:hypothetical protein
MLSELANISERLASLPVNLNPMTTPIHGPSSRALGEFATKLAAFWKRRIGFTLLEQSDLSS